MVKRNERVGRQHLPFSPSGLVWLFAMLLWMGQVGPSLAQQRALRGADTSRGTQQGPTFDNLFLITLDGFRWQELFTGADPRLIAGATSAETLARRYGGESAERRRSRLLPYFWSTIAPRAQIYGDPTTECRVQVTNGRFFSYPGYAEMLCGWADERIDSNDKRYNPNPTVLAFLNRRPGLSGHVRAFASWDVFPFIINRGPREELGNAYVSVNAGWAPLGAENEQVEQIARWLPKYWESARFDGLTFTAALHDLRKNQPRVLYLALDETDDWAHAGRYDLYLNAAHYADDMIRTLWEESQKLPAYRGRTAMVITSDHGRGDGREGWKSHSDSLPGSDRIWIVLYGPGIPEGAVGKGQFTQSQVAATVAALLGEDFAASDPRIAPRLPYATGGEPLSAAIANGSSNETEPQPSEASR